MNIKEQRILSSIPTNSVDENCKSPQSMGSGCFVDYGQHNIFLTVYHTIDDNSLTSGIVTDFDKDKGVLLLPLGLTPPIVSGNLFSKEISIVDFAYKKMKEMPPCKYFEVDSNGDIKVKVDRIKLHSDLSDMPVETEDYGFAGYIYGYPTNNPFVDAKLQKVWNQELGYYEGLKFKKSCGDYHVFSLQNNDYEVDDFRGTSGAPILDSKGKLVALVSHGGVSFDGKEWIVKGINLAKYKTIIDIECDLI